MITKKELKLAVLLCDKRLNSEIAGWILSNITYPTEILTRTEYPCDYDCFFCDKPTTVGVVSDSCEVAFKLGGRRHFHKQCLYSFYTKPEVIAHFKMVGLI